MPLDLTPQIQNVYNPGTVVKISYTATAAASGASLGANAVLLISTSACHVAFSDAGTDATTSDFYLPANVPIALACVPTNKISAVRDSADGSLFVTPLN